VEQARESEWDSVRSSKRLWIAALCGIAVVAAAVVWGVMHLGQWLVVEDPLTTAYAIVVLSGSMPGRAMEAARLYQHDFAARVWISLPTSPAAELEQMHIAFLGEEFYNEKVLMAEGVPSDAIRILEQPSVNTQEEVDEIARDCRSAGAHTVIIVTSKAHTRRVREIWKRRVGNDPRLIVRYTPDDSFDPAHWWRTSQDALDVVRETLGLANAWAGFPAHPEPH
jgi:uncharacterized SAM-binding protein YcdF (DUF218 family)